MILYIYAGWGNLKSLKTIPEVNCVDLLELLKESHKLHYRPERMKLVVMSPVSTLKILEDAVQSTFGVCWTLQTEDIPRSISSRKMSLATLEESLQGCDGVAVHESQLGKLTRIVPVRSTHNLRILFQLSPSKKHYRFQNSCRCSL
jgi:secreted Zn-dependent insulinase-like peptidase